MDAPQFEKLDRKLDLVLKMLAIDKLYEKKQIEQVAILTDFGMQTDEIASILGIKSSSVSAQQIQWRKRSKKATGGTSNEQE
ncbi:MAG: hypothetical protein ABSG25_11960 [Bryobacteraceae bacterium]|jgi:hypothetical protein